ncbi:DUF2490 domain-containing protein [Cyclobacteriaceae bacterium YHN15]|nr:DUF2490 domain-containing protein [Cyclobacteriaceae bacterium YHN15]
MKHSKINLVLTFFFFLMSITGFLNAQQDVRYWGSFYLNAPLTKKIDMRLNYLRSVETNESEILTNFNWYQIRVNYDINKNWDFQAGTAWMHVPSNLTTTNRFFGRVFKSSKINKRFILRNGIQIEHHSKEEKRFDQRVILISRLGLRKRLEFLKLAPSVSYLLFYNIGGTPLRYFNESGEQIAYQAANGFHRGRFILNLNSKISKQLRGTVFYMNQHEFNLGSYTRSINVLNPNTGRIQRSFNNYHVFGFSVSYTLPGANNKPYLENILTH